MLHLALAVSLAVSLSRIAHVQASGTFNILSMNVAGLPEILNGNGESGDKTTNTMVIGQVRVFVGPQAFPEIAILISSTLEMTGFRYIWL